MNYNEKEGKTPTDVDYLTQTVAMLTDAIKIQNDVVLCLLHKFDLEKDLPVWTTKEGLEEDVGPKVQACIEAVRKIYGRSETDKD